MANSNVLFTGTTSIVVGNLIQASDFEKDSSLLYDSAAGVLYTPNINVLGNALGNVVGSTGATGAAKMPTGTDLQRPASNAVGYTRYNTTTPGLELWDGTNWVAVGGGGSITVSTTAPATPVTGALWYNNTASVLRMFVWDSTAWVDASPAAGGVTIATTAQAQGWADNTTAISPLRLAESFQGTNQDIIGSSGYQKLPGGLIIQWGYTSVTNALSTITFPIAFPTNVFISGAPVSLTLGAAYTTYTTTLATTEMGIWNDGGYIAGAVYWIAIGY